MKLPVTALFFVMLPVAAHHSSAMYDQQQDIRLEGVVGEFEWVDPHVYIRVETEDEGGERVMWTVRWIPKNSTFKVIVSAFSIYRRS